MTSPPSPEQKSVTKMRLQPSSESSKLKTRWESEAMTMIHSDPTGHIRHLRIYGFLDKESFQNALQSCNIIQLHTINAYLTKEASDSKLEEPQLVEKIMELVEPTFSFLGLDFSWTWTPSSTEGLGLQQIASRINEGSYHCLKHLQFEECWRYAQGHTEPIVDHVVNQHKFIVDRIRGYLQQHPKLRTTFLEVETILQRGNPLALQAVHYGLAPNTPTNFCVDLLCEPLGRFAANQTQGLDAILRKLPVLVERFDRFWHQGRYLAYQSIFTTETSTFDALANVNVQEYAKATTTHDISSFIWLSFQKLHTRDPLHGEFFHDFNIFSNEIAECAAHPTLRSCLGEVAKVKKPHEFPKNLKLTVSKEFHRHHNWFRARAVLVGLEQAGVDTTKLNILNPRASKADLRAEMEARPGLPSPDAYTRYDSDFSMAFSIASVQVALNASSPGINQLGNMKVE